MINTNTAYETVKACRFCVPLTTKGKVSVVTQQLSKKTKDVARIVGIPAVVGWQAGGVYCTLDKIFHPFVQQTPTLLILSLIFTLVYNTVVD